MSTHTLERLSNASMYAENWAPATSFDVARKINNRKLVLPHRPAFIEYNNAKTFLMEYGNILKDVHKLDVSFVEIPQEKEAVLSWYNPKTATLKSITVMDDEDGFSMYLSCTQNGKSIPGKLFKSLNEFTCEI